MASRSACWKSLALGAWWLFISLRTFLLLLKFKKRKKFPSLVTGESRLKETHLWKQLTSMVFKTLWFFSKSSLMISPCWLQRGRSASWSLVLVSDTVTIVTGGKEGAAPAQNTGAASLVFLPEPGIPMGFLTYPGGSRSATCGSRAMAHQEFELNDGFFGTWEVVCVQLFN